ncbi:MAG: hypothetical protein KJN90_11090 [Gammaproteobacteria bacterium]|nr:hypothetical protein [Gammaproteobacteria bacterium]
MTVNAQAATTAEKLKELVAERYHADDLHAVEDACLKYLELKNDDPDIIQTLGVCQRRLGKNAESVASLKKARKLAPGNLNILKSLSRSLFANRDLSEYQQSIADLFSMNACSATMCIHSIQLFHRMGNKQSAITSCEKYLTRYADNPHLLNLYSVALKNVGKLPDSVEVGRKSLALSLTHPSEEKAPKKRPVFNTAENLNLLWQTLAKLKKHGFVAFPTAGTLLGLVREKSLLSGDKDIDIAIPFNDMTAVISVLEDDGWRQVGGSYSLSNPRQMVHQDYRLAIDLCGLLNEAESGKTIGGFWMEGIPEEWNRIVELPKPGVKAIDSPAGEVWWPNNPEEWLEAFYGENWRIPDTQFNTVICARNLRDFSLLVECYAINKLFAHWWCGEISKGLKIVNSVLFHRPDDELYLRLKQGLENAVVNKR